MAGWFDDNTISRIQQANDIIDVVGEHVNLKKKGREMVGVCPFHDDHSPSMNVSGEKQIFKCFACGAGGDVFKFIQMRENLTFPQAVQRLAERAHIDVKPVKSSGPQKPENKINPNILAKVNQWAAQYFRENLLDTEKGRSAREYLANRSISDQSAEKWQIGLALDRDDLIETAKKKNANVQLLFDAGLAVRPKDSPRSKDKFVNRLMFPITDVTGRVIGFGGRTLEGADAKYLNTPATPLFDKSNCIYGLEHARHHIVSSGRAVVVEGYTDVIMAHQTGCANVVATLGTSFTTGHARILKRYARNAILLFDNDVAGTAAAARALQVCMSQRMDIKIASIPQGKDPCDYLLAAGKEEFEKVLESAADVFDFQWERLKDKFNSEDTLAGQKAALDEFLQTVAAAVKAVNLSPIETGLIVNRLSRLVGIENKQINQELKRKFGRAPGAGTQQWKNQKVQSLEEPAGPVAGAQREILEVLLAAPDMLGEFSEELKPDIFHSQVYRQLADAFFDAARTEPEPALTSILRRIESEQLGGLITEMAHIGQEKGNYRQRLSQAIETLREHRMRQDTERIKEKGDQETFLRSIKGNCRKLGM